MMLSLPFTSTLRQVPRSVSVLPLPITETPRPRQSIDLVAFSSETTTGGALLVVLAVLVFFAAGSAFAADFVAGTAFGPGAALLPAPAAGAGAGSPLGSSEVACVMTLSSPLRVTFGPLGVVERCQVTLFMVPTTRIVPTASIVMVF